MSISEFEINSENGRYNLATSIGGSNMISIELNYYGDAIQDGRFDGYRNKATAILKRIKTHLDEKYDVTLGEQGDEHDPVACLYISSGNEKSLGVELPAEKSRRKQSSSFPQQRIAFPRQLKADIASAAIAAFKQERVEINPIIEIVR